MPIDLNTLLESQYNDYNARKTSLSDRLAEIEAYTKTIRPRVIADTVAVGRAPTEAPIDVRSQQLAAGSNMVDLKNSVYQEQNQNANTLNSIISALLSQEGNKIDLLKATGLDLSGIDQTTIASKIDELKTPIRKDVEGLTNAIIHMDDIEKKFAKLYPNGVSDAEGPLKTLTGPLAANFGKYFTSAELDDLRNQIGVMSDERRKEIFGSAFTNIERQVGKIPDTTKQEADNISIIKQLKEAAVRELTSKLQNSGWSPEQIESYFSMKNVGSIPTASSGGYVTMTNPEDGQQYEVPKDKEEEARQNGWR